jgi:regulator of RNase E activity RraB
LHREANRTPLQAEGEVVQVRSALLRWPDMPSWEPDFDAYFAMVDGAPASFLVDLAAGPNAPLPTHPTRLQVRVTLAQPREDGMRDAAELEPLGQLEDALVEWLEQTYGAIYVGHLITDGALHVVAYAPPERVGDPSDLLEGFDPGDYEVGWLIEDDPEWGMLLEFLYPDAYAMQVIQNRRLMSARAEHGDDPSLVHTVDHTASFATREQADEAAEALARAGFEIEAVTADDQADGWTVNFKRDERLDGDRPDEFCVEILELIEPFEGAYWGWGAMIVRSPTTN